MHDFMSKIKLEDNVQAEKHEYYTEAPEKMA